MLTEQEQQAIGEELRHYPQPRAAVSEALKIVQRHRGWVSDESVRDIGAALDLTPAEVDSVATFYSMIFRRPVGRHVILICDSVSCWIMGANPLQAHLAATLGIQPGATTADGRFTLLPCACLGACDRAPALMIDDDLHVDLTLEKLGELLEKYA
ncbi:MAG: NADH-quinone oxidoreductase subunit NuoE [Kiritimatiellaeota bacterium]|nr:NADH-quinone oxidoreductase subunit NuoE [Kiritimatiellota bacterium]